LAEPPYSRSIMGPTRSIQFLRARPRPADEEKIFSGTKVVVLGAGTESAKPLRGNVDAWYKVYGVGPAGKLYLKPEDRAVIWCMRTEWQRSSVYKCRTRQCGCWRESDRAFAFS
jgi:hypothetical protein